MDFMKLIESLDEALYSVMSWLVFYPLTLWRTLVRPQAMMAYAENEALDDVDEFDDVIRPPLFLFLTLLISHGLETVFIGQNPIIASRHGLAALVDGDFALLALRMVLFSLFTMMMAVRLVRREGTRLTHTSLRRPFYAQCFATGVFALVLSCGTTLTQAGTALVQGAGAVIVLAALVWYLGVQSTWFARKLNISFVAGFGNALLATTLALVIFATFAALIM